MNNASPGRKSPALLFAFWARAFGVALLLGVFFTTSCTKYEPWNEETTSNRPNGKLEIRTPNASYVASLGFLPQCYGTHATAISGDGKVVVGCSVSDRGGITPNSRGEAFRWTASEGMRALGYLPGDIDSCANAVNYDGSVIVGTSQFCPIRWERRDKTGKVIASDNLPPSRCQAVRWITTNGITRIAGLGFLVGESKWSLATGVSADGKVIVGESGSSPYEDAFRWTESEGMRGIGKSTGALGCSECKVSGDGTVVIGKKIGGYAFRWTAAEGMVGLATLRYEYSYAKAVSGDGSVVVGYFTATDCDRAACRWTTEKHVVSYEFRADEFRGQYTARDLIAAITAKGIEVPEATSEIESLNKLLRGPKLRLPYSHIFLAEEGKELLKREATLSDEERLGLNRYILQDVFRWKCPPKELMHRLGDLAGPKKTRGMRSEALAITRDGSVIVGISCGDAFVWDSVNGMRSLKTILVNDYHLDLTGWSLEKATGISDDGKTIVGDGFHNKASEAWIAHLDRPLNAPAGKERSR
ncbi:MAG: hypothetical protein NTY01_09830 [Verrucomicrobia bacterium]|nr:hypothetical protein [Verrucomicrobiota bacterium]